MADDRVLFIDFESDPASISERLLMLGATAEAIRDRFVYVRPEVDPEGNAVETAAWNGILSRRYALAVIDGVTDALGVSAIPLKTTTT